MIVPDYLSEMRKLEYFMGYPCDKEDCSLYKAWEEQGLINIKPKSNPMIVLLCLSCHHFNKFDHYKVIKQEVKEKKEEKK
jgi:hypothetical protein